MTVRSSTANSVSWPAVATTPRAPLSATVARLLFDHAVRRVPVRACYPDGRVLGAGLPDSPEFEIVRPAAFFARLGRDSKVGFGEAYMAGDLSLIHISEPTRLGMISYAVFCLKK